MFSDIENGGTRWIPERVSFGFHHELGKSDFDPLSKTEVELFAEPRQGISQRSTGLSINRLTEPAPKHQKLSLLARGTTILTTGRIIIIRSKPTCSWPLAREQKDNGQATVDLRRRRVYQSRCRTFDRADRAEISAVVSLTSGMRTTASKGYLNHQNPPSAHGST